MGLGNAMTQTAAAIIAQFAPRVDYLGTSLMQAQLGNEDARTATADRAWRAYDGDFPPPFAPRKGQPAGQDVVRVNRLAPVVDASVQFLFGTPPTYQIVAPPVDPAAPTPPPDPLMADDAAWMEAVQRANTWDAMLLDWGTTGAVGGHAYLRLVPPVQTLPPGPQDWASLDPAYLPSVHPLDPATVRKLTDPRNTAQTTGYVWTWRQGRVSAAGTPQAARQLIEPHPTTPGWWLITDQETGGGGVWATTAQTAWPFPFPPIVDCKNLPAPNAVYGAPDLTDSMIEINKAINFTLSNSLRVYRLHGHPKLAAFGTQSGDVLDAAPDVVWQFQSPESRVEQYTPAVQPTAGESLLKAFDGAIQQESRTPALILGMVEKGLLTPSGVALRTEMWPLLMKTQTKRTAYGPALEEVWRRLFLICRRPVPRRVTVTWPEILPVDPLQERQALQIDVTALGASKTSALKKLAYDPAVEAANRAAESTDVGGAANPTGTAEPAASADGMEPGEMGDMGGMDMQAMMEGM